MMFEIGERIFVITRHQKISVMVVTPEWAKLTMSETIPAWEEAGKWLDRLISHEAKVVKGDLDEILCGWYGYTSPDGCFVAYRKGSKWYTEVRIQNRWSKRVVSFARETE